MTEQEARKELDKILETNPKMKFFQNRLENIMNNVGNDPLQRLQILFNMMGENLEKLQEKLQELKEEVKNVDV